MRAPSRAAVLTNLNRLHTVLVETAPNTWQASVLPVWLGQTPSVLRSTLVSLASDGTVYAYGLSRTSSQPRLAFGSGAFFTEEAVPGLGASPTQLSLGANGAPVLTAVVEGTRYTPLEALAQVTVQRRARTGPGSFTALPSRVFDSKVRYSSSGASLGYGLLGLDAALEPTLATTRERYARGAGLDVTQWPAGAQRTEELDWREATRALSAAIDGADAVHVLVGAGEGGASRLVVRSQRDGGWVEGPAALPAPSGDPAFATLRIDAQGRKRVLVTALQPDAGSALTLAAEDAAGQWQREVVHPYAVADATLLVDAAGAPHVCFEAAGTTGGRALWYATRATTGWRVELAVDGTGTTPPRCSLAVDSAGVVLAMFRQADGYAIGVARRTSSGWQTAQLARDGNAQGAVAYRDAQGRACVLHVVASVGLTSRAWWAAAFKPPP